MKHFIIVKFNDCVKDKSALISEIKTFFESAKSLSFIQGVEVHSCCIDLSNRYDVMIIINLEKSNLNQWIDCDIHHKWKSQFSKYILSKAIFDLE